MYGFNENVYLDALSKISIVSEEKKKTVIEETVKLPGKEYPKAGTAFEAVEACRNNPDIDLILMDIQIPGMGGYEAAKLIRLTVTRE